MSYCGFNMGGEGYCTEVVPCSKHHPAPADAAPVPCRACAGGVCSAHQPEPRPCCERTERETVARVVKMLWRRAAKAEELAEEYRLALDFKGRDDWEEHAAALRIFADDLEREGVRRG